MPIKTKGILGRGSLGTLLTLYTKGINTILCTKEQETAECRTMSFNCAQRLTKRRAALLARRNAVASFCLIQHTLFHCSLS